MGDRRAQAGHRIANARCIEIRIRAERQAQTDLTAGFDQAQFTDGTLDRSGLPDPPMIEADEVRAFGTHPGEADFACTGLPHGDVERVSETRLQVRIVRHLQPSAPKTSTSSKRQAGDA